MPLSTLAQIFLALSYGMAQNLSMTIERGSEIEVRTASGQRLPMRALGKPTRGRDFPVVWVCTEEEFQRSARAGDDADGIPWPLDAVGELAKV
jgi:hypothetical protein